MKKLRNLFRRQDGVAMIMVLALMVLAVPLVTSALSLASTLSIDSRVRTHILKSQYSLIGATQDAAYRLFYNPAYDQSLIPGAHAETSLTLDGEEISVSVVKMSDPAYVINPPPADDSRRLQTTKVVTPATAEPNTLTSFTYTIMVENRDDTPQNITKIRDEMPPGFDYVVGSTTGVTTNDPGIAGGNMTWDLQYLNIVLQPLEFITLTFNAQASVETGNYCNETYSEPGGLKTSSGKTAIVRVGSPPNNLCSGAAVRLTKTVTPQIAPALVPIAYTYTITLESIGTSTVRIQDVQDMLPEGFTYVPGSTTGDITLVDPSIMVQQGRERLTWNVNPNPDVGPGATKFLTFQATGQVDAGNYWNEAFIDVTGISYTVYTWPTAPVQVMGVFRVTATNGQYTVSANLWVGQTTFIFNKWDLTANH